MFGVHLTELVKAGCNRNGVDLCVERARRAVLLQTLSRVPHLALWLSFRQANLYESSRRSDWDFWRRSLVCVPGNRRAQTSHHMDEEREEGQLPALRGNAAIGTPLCSRPGLATR